MKLGDMTFDDSRIAELKIVPIIEKIMANKDTAKVCDDLFLGETPTISDDATEEERKKVRIDAIKKRVGASKELTKRLIHSHYDEICEIFAILNGQKADEIKAWSRNEANDQIADMLNDPDLVSFFMSSEALAQAVLSAI